MVPAGVCILDYYQSNYKYRRIYGKRILLFQSGIFPFLEQNAFQELEASTAQNKDLPTWKLAA